MQFRATSLITIFTLTHFLLLPPNVSARGMIDTKVKTLTSTTQEILDFTKDIKRVAVSDESILSFELITNRELLVQGRKLGRTNLIVWFEDKTRENYEYIIKESAALMEETIRKAIHNLKDGIGQKVQVRRLVRGNVPDGKNDLIVLEGTVPNQVALTRVLTLASLILTGSESNEKFIRVLADEGGALVPKSQGTASTQQSSSSTIFRSGRSGGNSSGLEKALRNRIGSSIGRAKAIQAADGRILSFIEVDDIPRVRVSIKIMELNRTKLKDLDSDLTFLLSDFDQGSLTRRTLPTTIGGSPAVESSPLFKNSPDFQNIVSALGGVFTGQSQAAFDRVSIDAVISALNTKGVLRTLSEPTLNVLSGETALFQVGGQVPISAATATTAVVISSIQFADFGVELAVRPLVDEDDKITLDVIPRVSDPVTNAFSTLTDAPAFETRTLKTTAQILDGQSLLLGGLIKRKEDVDVSKVPFFSEIPLVGSYFEDETVDIQDIELIIMVTPAIERFPISELSLWKFPEITLDQLNDKEASSE